MIVDYYDIEREVTVLAEGAFHRILHCPDPVEHRYHHSRRHRELLLRHFRFLENWSQPAAYPLQVSGADLLHFQLHGPVLGVHIVKLLLSGLSGISLYLGIKIFVYMNYLLHPEPQIVKGAPLIILLHSPYGLPQRGPPEHQHTSEIEVIPEGSHLAVDKGMTFPDLAPISICDKIIKVCIQHVGTGVLRNGNHAVQREQSHFQGLVLGIYEYIFMRNSLSDAPQGFCRPERHTGKYGHSCKGFASAERLHRHLQVFT